MGSELWYLREVLSLDKVRTEITQAHLSSLVDL